MQPEDGEDAFAATLLIVLHLMTVRPLMISITDRTHSEENSYEFISFYLSDSTVRHRSPLST